MTTESQIATPPSIAVGFLCQRSVLGTATKPKRRANARTRGVSMSARQNDAATVITELNSLAGSTPSSQVVIDYFFENPIEAHLGAKADKLADLRNIRHATRHVLESFFVSFIVRHKHDFGIGVGKLFDAFR